MLHSLLYYLIYFPYSCQALLFGGGDLPAFIARQYIPALDIVVDPCAAILVFIVTGLLCVGIKEVTFFFLFSFLSNIFSDVLFWLHPDKSSCHVKCKPNSF